MGVFETSVSLLASLSSLAVYLSLAPSLYRVVRQRKTGDVSLVPLVSMLANCHMWGMYGYLVENLFPLLTTMVLGTALALGYIFVFCRYTAQPKRALKTVAATFGFLLLVTAYVVLGTLGLTSQTREQVATVMGYVGSVVSFLLYSSPFEKMAQVLRSRSAKSIPIGLCAASAVGNLLWAASGVVRFDLFVLVPNAVCAVPPLVQIALYLAFRPRHHTVVLNYSAVNPGPHAATPPPEGKVALQ